MKNPVKLFVAFACVVAILLAQAPTTIQQTSTRLDAATYAATNVTSNTTTTVTVPATQYFYLTGVDIINCAGSSAVTAATVTTITTTGFAGGGPAWTVGSGVTAGLCTNQAIPFTSPLKSATPGTNVTFVIPTFATNQTIRFNAYGYFGQ